MATLNDMYIMAHDFADFEADGDNEERNELFDCFQTPDNEDVPFNKTAFMNYIQAYCGYFEVIYDSFEMFCSHLYSWTGTRLPSWQRMYDALCLDYDPLENYNLHERRHDKNKRNEEDHKETAFDQTANTTEEVTQNTLDVNHDEYNGESTTHTEEDADIAGYDSGSLVDRDAKTSDTNYTEEHTDDQHNTEDITKNDVTDYTTHSDEVVDATQDEKKRLDQKQWHHGKTGDKSYAELIQEEIDLALQNSIYTVIGDEFKKEFCLLVY